MLLGTKLKLKLQIANICKKNKEEESCGFIVLDNHCNVKIIECQNCHEDPENYFRISPDTFLNIDSQYNIVASYHSHIKQSPAPSGWDITAFEELCLPYYIYSLKDETFFLGFPKSYEPINLIGRVYVEDLFQCSTLIKDYFQLKLGKDIGPWLKNWIVPKPWTVANKLIERTLKKNATEVPKENMQPGDIVLFCIKLKAHYHLGICVGNNELLHQPTDCLSGRVLLDDRWLSKVYKVYRNTEL